MTTEPLQVRLWTGVTGTWHQTRWRDTMAVVLAVCLGLIVIATIFAPLIAPYSPNATDVFAISAPPSSSHLLGTDDLGRDILSRLLDGARLSLLGPLAVVVLSTAAGVTLAVTAAWHGGLYATVIGRVLDLLFSVPSLLVAILAVAFVGPGLIAPVVALVLAYTPYAARVVQSVAIRERNLPYIEAEELAGIGALRICLRHLVPNVLPIIRAQATVAFGSALLDLATISFLGLGVQPPAASWGLMVANGEPALLNGSPWAALIPTIIIIFVVICVNVIGSTLESRRSEDR